METETVSDQACSLQLQQMYKIIHRTQSKTRTVEKNNKHNPHVHGCRNLLDNFVSFHIDVY